MEINHSEVKFERYADDIIVHCMTEEESEQLLEQIGERLIECGLTLHPKKTKIVYCADSNRREKTKRPREFTFLGFDFKPRKTWNTARKRAFTGFDLGISHQAKVRIRKVVSGCIKQMPMGSDLEDLGRCLRPG